MSEGEGGESRGRGRPKDPSERVGAEPGGTIEPFRIWSTRGLRKSEYVANVSIAMALALAGAALFVHVSYRFLVHLDDSTFVDQILQRLDGLLLVFILSELLHTVRATVEEDVS